MSGHLFSVSWINTLKPSVPPDLSGFFSNGEQSLVKDNFFSAGFPCWKVQNYCKCVIVSYILILCTFDQICWSSIYWLSFLNLTDFHCFFFKFQINLSLCCLKESSQLSFWVQEELYTHRMQSHNDACTKSFKINSRWQKENKVINWCKHVPQLRDMNPCKAISYHCLAPTVCDMWLHHHNTYWSQRKYWTSRGLFSADNTNKASL